VPPCFETRLTVPAPGSTQNTSLVSRTREAGEVKPEASHIVDWEVQLPPTHTSPLAHAWPQEPQLEESVWVIAHAEPHSDHPAWHSEHVPRRHAGHVTIGGGVAQYFVQVPQVLLLF
jgi:hypothetical protein